MRLHEPKCDKCIKNKITERLNSSKRKINKSHDEIKDDDNHDIIDKNNCEIKEDNNNNQNEKDINLNQNDSNNNNIDEHDNEGINDEYSYDENSKTNSISIAIAKCLDCELNLCSNCLLEHQIINLDLNHKLINLSLNKNHIINQNIVNDINNNNNLKINDKNIDLFNSFIYDKNNNIHKYNGKCLLII